jgi:hypothetical protein
VAPADVNRSGWEAKLPSTSHGSTVAAVEVTLTANIAVNVTLVGIGGAACDVDGARD